MPESLNDHEIKSLTEEILRKMGEIAILALELEQRTGRKVSVDFEGMNVETYFEPVFQPYIDAD